MDSRTPRDGRVIEELGTYDPMVPDSDARAILNGDRIAYWLSVGALPTRKVNVLIQKYGKDGTHLDQQQQALNRLAARRGDAIATAAKQAAEFAAAAPPPAPAEPPADEAPAEAAADSDASDGAADDGGGEEAAAEAVAEAPAETSADTGGDEADKPASE